MQTKILLQLFILTLIGLELHPEIAMRYFFVIVLLLTLPFFANAQLCQGSLGDPVVNITFGTDASQSTTFTATNYISYNYDCPNDGFYTLESSTSNCFGSSWHTLSEDHTPNDVRGRMMVVNASYAAGDFYVDTVLNLCSNTTYELAAWVVNVLKPSACSGNGIKPNLTFSIEKTDGTILKSVNSGDIPATSSPSWKQYGFFFQTPEDVTNVVLRLTNNTGGGCGNDLALDDITFRPCGAKVIASVTGLNVDSIDICEGVIKQFQLAAALSGEYANPAGQWQASIDSGKTWRDISGESTLALNVKVDSTTPAQEYLYRLGVSEQNNISLSSCRIISNVVAINVNAKPDPAASNNGPLCEGNDLTLQTSGGIKYLWKGPNDYTSTDATATISKASLKNKGTYTVTVTYANTCVNSASTVVDINPVPKAVVSNSVSICEGVTTGLTASGGTFYEWNPGVGLSNPNIANPSASPADSTIYVVTVGDGAGCTDTASVAVNVLKKPGADAGPDVSVVSGSSIELKGSVAGSDVTYYWTPNIFIDNYQSLTPTVSPPRDTTYTLHVKSNAGCGVAEDAVFVRVYQKVIVPNAFSPNGDGINDVWKIEALDAYPRAEVMVFNRYGQVVTKRKGSAKPWDGTYQGEPIPVGTYYYIIDLHEGQGKLTGWVMILR